MADLFISYSRRDQEFVRRLHQALTERGKVAWVDWEDIPPTAKWRDEIRAAVAGSDAFGFVLTPDSLVSEVCGEELQMAVEQNKRIVPLLRREPDGTRVPHELAAHNWIFFSDDDEFEHALATLVRALETDVERTHLHTRLLVRATEWDERDREASRLLRGNDLREAEGFLEADADPQATVLQREYVAASRQHSSRRLRMLLVGVSVALVLSVALGVVALLERNTAQARERQAVSRSLAALAVTQLGVDPERGVLLAREAVARNATPEADLALRRSVGADQLRATLRHGGPVRWVDFSPDGRYVVTSSDDRSARLWDARTGRALHVLSHRAEVNFADFSRDGSEVVTASADGTARAWQAASGRPLGPPLPGPVALGKALSDGELVAAIGAPGTRYGAVLVWDARTGRLVKTLGKPGGPELSDLAISPDGRLVAAGADDGGVRIWDLSSGRSRALRGHRKRVNRVVFSPDGRLLASGSDDGTARLWDLEGHPLAILHGDQKGTFQGFKFVDGIEDLAFSPNGRYIATAGLVRGNTRVWEVPSGRLVSLLPGRASVYAVRFSPDGQLLVTGGVDRETRIWETFSGRLLASLTGHTGLVNSVAFSPDGSRVATAGVDGTARVWETYPGRPLAQIPGGSALVAALDYPSGHGILTAGAEGASVIDPNTGQTLAHAPQPLVDAQVSADGSTVLLVSQSGVRAVDAATLGHQRAVTLQNPPGQSAEYAAGSSMSRDGRLILCPFADGTAGLWDGTTGRLLATLPAVSGPLAQRMIVSSDVSADGSHALTATNNDQVRVFDAGGHQVDVLSPGAPVNGAVFSPGGAKVAVSGTNPPGGTGPAVWDVRTGLQLFQLHDNFGVFNAAFSHDGRLLVTAGIGGTVTIWNVATGTGTTVQGGPVGAADHALFSPDDRLIAVAGYDGTTRLFDVRSGVNVAVLQGSLLPLYTVAFGSADSPLLTVDSAGALRVFACDVCGPTSHVLQAAGTIVTRALSSGERATYLPSG